MTPAARINAAIDLLDLINGGALADRALADWGRKNRYAGSKDRAAIADLVYDVLRQRRTAAALGGGETGRALLLGLLRLQGREPDEVFGRGTYAPVALSDVERAAGYVPEPGLAEAADMPDWVWPDLQTALGAEVEPVADVMRTRADVHLRVNLAKADRDTAQKALARDGVLAGTHPLSQTALRVTEGARRIRQSEAYLDGWVELQDAASQAVSDMVPLTDGQSHLDFCAGGGGKTLAVAGRVSGRFFAHDVSPKRMKDVPERAKRAGASVRLVTKDDIATVGRFDTVLVDAPCSGSGSWRRDPQGKWLLERDGLDRVRQVQADILLDVAPMVLQGGHLVYATCSLLNSENRDQVDRFLAAHPDYSMKTERKFTPLEGGDGFYCAVLQRKT